MEQKEIISIKGIKLPYYPKVFNVDENTPVLNLSVAEESLSLLKSIAEKYLLPIILMYGTLLGAIRENSFLKHDEDIDLIVDIKYENILLEMIPELEKVGLLFIRYLKVTLFKKGNIIYSFMRNGIWIDIYLMQNAFNGYIITGRKFPKKYFERFDTLSFYHHDYFIPHDSEGLLAFIYGDDWKIPKLDFHAPRIKLIPYVSFIRFLSNVFSRMPFVKNILIKVYEFITKPFY